MMVVPKFQILLLTLLYCIIIAVLPAIVHEFGHAIFHVLLGGKLDHIQPFIFQGAPYTRYATVPYNTTTSALVSAAGVLLPVLIAVLGLLAIPFRRINNFNRIFLSILFISLLGQLIGYIFLPLISYFNVGTFKDDVFEFLAYSGWHPFIVSFLALLIFILCLVLLLKRTKIITLLKSLRKVEGRSEFLNLVMRNEHEENRDNRKKGDLSGRVGVSIWTSLLLAILIFTIGHLNSAVPPSNPNSLKMSMDRGSFEDYVVTAINHPRQNSKDNLVLDFDIDIKAGEFDLFVKDPEGQIVWEKRISPAGMPLKDRALIPLNSEGKWLILFSKGEVEGLKVNLNWSLINKLP